MKKFLGAAAIQFVSYFILVVNFRAIAHDQVLWAMVTDAAAAAMSFTIISRIAKDDSRWVLTGMMTGGSLAAAAGMWWTRTWGH